MSAKSRVPVVSVVMGVYNAQRYVSEAIESVLNQTFSDFELIVVDDGSTDKTPDILQEYQARDPRLKVLRIAHAGIVAAANAGLAVARAELIARADADDVCLPERFARQVNYMGEHPECVCLGSRMLLIEPYGCSIGQTHHKLVHEEIEADLLSGSGWAMPQPAAMIRKAAIEKIGGYREKYLWSEDLDLFLRLAEVGRLANLPDVLVKYRNHPGSTNHRRAEIQTRLSRQCVIETYRRRGLEVPPNLSVLVPRDHGEKPARYLNWTWAALRARNVYAARRHALHALRLAPFSSHCWRATFCALRGY